jgi:hypothetical protein
LGRNVEVESDGVVLTLENRNGYHSFAVFWRGLQQMMFYFNPFEEVVKRINVRDCFQFNRSIYRS